MGRVIIERCGHGVFRNNHLPVNHRRLPWSKIILANVLVVIPKLLGGAIDLLMETAPPLIARLIIQTAVSRGPVKLVLCRGLCLNEALLFLQQGQKKLGVDAMILRGAVDKLYGRGALARIQCGKKISEVTIPTLKKPLNIHAIHRLIGNELPIREYVFVIDSIERLSKGNKRLRKQHHKQSSRDLPQVPYALK